MSGVTIAISYLEQIIGTIKWLKKVATEGLTETPGVGFEDCFEAVLEGFATIGSLPKKNVPGFEIREVVRICPVLYVYLPWLTSIRFVVGISSKTLLIFSPHVYLLWKGLRSEASARF